MLSLDKIYFFIEANAPFPIHASPNSPFKENSIGDRFESQSSLSKPIYDTDKNDFDNLAFSREDVHSFTSSRPQEKQFRYGSESFYNIVTEKEKEEEKTGQNKNGNSEKIKDYKERKITSSSVGTDPIPDDEYKN